MKRFILALLCVQCVCAWSAENGAKDALTLSRTGAAEFALQNNLELKAIKTGIDAARARKLQSGRLSNPVVGAEYGNDMLFQNEGEYNVRASISQKFPLFGRLSKETDAANIDIKLAENEYLQAKQTLSRDTQLAYVDALEKQAAVSAKKEILRSMQSLAKAMKPALKSAEVAPLEYKRVQSECSKMQIEIMEGEIEEISALSVLKTKLGLEQRIKIKLSDSLSEIRPSNAKFSNAVLERRPDYQMFKLACENSAAQIALIKAGKYEDIEVGIFFESSYETDEPVGKTRYNGMGLSVSIPLPLNSFDGSIGEKLAMRRQAETRAAAMENIIINEISLYKMRAQKYSKIVNRYNGSLEKETKQIYQQYIEARNMAQASLADVFGAWQTNLQLQLLKTGAIANQARNSIYLNYALGFDNKDEK